MPATKDRAAVVFDDGLGRLAPLTDLRAAFDLRTGATTTLKRLIAFSPIDVVALVAPAELSTLTAERHRWAQQLDQTPDDLLLLNGRCVVPPAGLEGLAPGEAILEPYSNHAVAVRLTRAQAAHFLDSRELPDDAKPRLCEETCLLHDPWDVVRYRDRAIAIDLAAQAGETRSRLPDGVTRVGDGPLLVDETASVYPGAIIDVDNGPVVIGPDAAVRPGAIVCGPASIGPGATVVERAHIKANTAIGPVCKVGGEVGGTIFQGYANKAHEGHLGDSWVAEWVNLGAGTTNSNLLNTYDDVIARGLEGAQRKRTGLTFLGAILGAHVKTAICTRLMTGSVVGCGAMIASTAAPPTTVAPYAWITDSGESLYRFDKFLEVARRVMHRRGARPSDAEIIRLRSIHDAAANARSGATVRA